MKSADSAGSGRLFGDEKVPVRTVGESRGGCGFVALELGGGFGLPDDVDASYDVLVELLVEGLEGRRRIP